MLVGFFIAVRKVACLNIDRCYDVYVALSVYTFKGCYEN